jgi:HEAT repeat protein
VRGFAARALGRIADPRGAPPLAARLGEEPDSWCKAVMSEALAQLKHREAVAALVDEALPKDAPGRLGVLRGLDLLKREGFDRRLAALQEREPGNHGRVLGAIREHGEAAAVPVLIVLLESADQETRAEANKLLVAVTRADQGFDAARPEPQRREAIARWQAWWKERLDEWGAASGR